MQILYPLRAKPSLQEATDFEQRDDVAIELEESSRHETEEFDAPLITSSHHGHAASSSGEFQGGHCIQFQAIVSEKSMSKGLKSEVWVSFSGYIH